MPRSITTTASQSEVTTVDGRNAVRHSLYSKAELRLRGTHLLSSRAAPTRDGTLIQDPRGRVDTSSSKDIE